MKNWKSFIATIFALCVLCFVPAACSAATSPSVTLTWTASTSTDATLGYNVFRSTVTGTEAAPALNASPVDLNCSGTTCTYVDTTVARGTTYYYVVQAIETSDGLASANSNEVTAIIPNNPAPPTSLILVVH